MTLYPLEASGAWNSKTYLPLDLICRWCEFNTHDELGIWWVNFRCALDGTEVDMWGTCAIFEAGMGRRVAAMSAHDKAATLARKGETYRLTPGAISRSARETS